MMTLDVIRLATQVAQPLIRVQAEQLVYQVARVRAEEVRVMARVRV